MIKLAGSGVKVAILTNSLAATDVAAVHTGYSRYRAALLKCGVSLYELKALAGQGSFSLRGSGKASLHTKAFSSDRRYGFVGSLNFDPRSISLNTEMGVIFDSPQLVAKMNLVFGDEIKPELSYTVTCNSGSLRWTTVADGHTEILTREPDAKFARRIVTWLVGWLPLESQL